MRIPIRTSRWAIWARRLGGFSLPLAVLSVLMHRGRFITTEVFHIVGTVTIAVAGLALLVGLGAFVRLWRTGDRGWGRATTGILLGAICVSPLAIGAIDAAKYPMISDVSTSFRHPPELTTKPVFPEPPVDLANALAIAFPNMVTRRYLLSAARVAGIVDELVAERGWDVRRHRRPIGSLGQGQLNALAMTWFGWRDEVAIRVKGDFDGSTLDMRSASFLARHDLGRNGRRIEAFLVDLDARITELIVENPLDIDQGEPLPGVPRDEPPLAGTDG